MLRSELVQNIQNKYTSLSLSDIERLFGFYAIFGFLSCVGLIIFAKFLGFLIKRKDDYYDV